MSEHDKLSIALERLKRGEIDAETIRDNYSDVDGIEKSIAVAKSKKINTKSRGRLQIPS